ncbi:alpha/beta fold hydrolase [Mariniblastus sp.]|nr:alpha/beta fold hydrolase [Mariniblastus sp.]
MILGILSLSGCITAHTRTLLSASAVSRLGGAKSVVEVEKSHPASALGWKRWFQEVEPPSQRTALLLRRYDLEDANLNSPDQVIRWLHQLTQDRPSLEEVHALAELAEKQARWSAGTGDAERATRMYSTAIIHAYRFLFDGDLNIARNAYDPQFRSICDIYNRSLEALLRQVIADENFGHGYQAVLGTTEQGVQLTVQVDGRWKDQLFERFELVSDYEVSGFKNEHRTYGLGAPLIAVRKSLTQADDVLEKHYPPELTIPLTAFLNLQPTGNDASGTAGSNSGSAQQKMQTAVLTLYDPLEKTYVRAEDSTVPLESNITTPLAYGLKDPLVNKGLLATASLLDAEFAPEAYGMFMVEPYDPNKIPVVLVHGLWDGPATWAHMINDLAANRELHDNYQFWFYSYPTAQPFWVSANQFRKDLRAIRIEVDPQQTNPVMDEMVLVGHSMGGLISMLQTIDSGERFWEIVSDRPISELKGDPEAKAALQEMFYFEANPSIKKLITLATPFKGSDFANRTTQWISQRLITLPTLITSDFGKLALQNADILKDPYFLTRSNSIDSLATTNPMFKVIAESKLPKGLSFHNVVGRLDKTGMFGRQTAEGSDVGDGVVALSSGVCPLARSQVYVSAEHTTLHQQPGSILEVRRLLLEQLAEDDRVEARPIPPSLRSANSDAYYRQ